MGITNLMSIQIVSNVQSVVIVRQQLKQFLVLLDIIKIKGVRQHVFCVQLEQAVMVHQPAHVRFQNILLLECPTVLAVLLVTFALMSLAMVCPHVNLEHMSTIITVNNVQLVPNAPHQFRVRLLVLVLLIAVLMQADKGTPFVKFVPQDHHALQQVQPAVMLVNIHWKVSAIAKRAQMTIFVLQPT